MYNVKVLRENPNKTIRDIGDKLTELQERIEAGADPASDMIDDFAKALAPAIEARYYEGYEEGLGHGYSNGIAEY